jgi:orotate phosphoribosyltransferase-like protein
MPRKRDSALVEKARALASEGKTQAEVSTELRVPVRTLQSWGIDWPMGRPKVSDESASPRTARRRHSRR